ncbi:bifunctional RNA recognition motif domain/Nucleotide-binding alpha-beta plait domain superfamily/RNA-binding domain superfamily [Babesia duncani]|uniref:Bifunctional RNA recognition motif domain/Nucleotide-binding alpha-beta plait domain superfamily/RNA-binding domain superfamily n=1 Tax=Babesia duncani TaxID=323732 RepID=A0AAD9UQL9_9APIC|nr:bifunctional RNA recognition motif domain/Nucleotide-binding alpha-beta plait domain superfamily/RNA-binding domain superfamily [Babesia duncani]
MGNSDQSSRVYVGNLSEDVTQEDLEREFERIGKITSCEIKKTVSGAAFAFLEFEDARDAQDAIKEKDGADFNGRRLRVEAPLAPREDFNNRDHRRHRDRTRDGKYVVVVSNLPPTGSWQDLKDLMRDAGDVGHASVFRGGVGEVSFFSRRDMEYAIDKFDGASFKSHEGEKSRISVREKRGGHRRSRSYSHRRRGSYGRDRSPRRSYSIDKRRRSRSYSGPRHR